MISASHNPIEWNALKFIGPSGLFLSAAEGAEMRAEMEAGARYATWDQLGAVAGDARALGARDARRAARPAGGRVGEALAEGVQPEDGAA